MDGGTRKHRLRKGVPDAFRKWSQANTTGNIVIIYDGRQMSIGNFFYIDSYANSKPCICSFGIDDAAKEETKKLMCDLEEQVL